MQSNGNKVDCPRCQLYQQSRAPGLLHYYDFTPLPEMFEGGQMFFNVTEVRMHLNSAVIEIERPPYTEGFLNTVSLHEYVPGHIDHIPDDKIRPTLCASVSVKKTGGLWQIMTLILDGHHSAMKLISQSKPVVLHVVPHQIIDKLVRHSLDELMNQEVVVLQL